ncbi:MAG TPA: peptidoglycan-binding protein [Candidatus Paceibacterota bacterium]|nr:peptidoglycan-binding protein [Candidatus Paceibacterota bacterium]
MTKVLVLPAPMLKVLQVFAVAFAFMLACAAMPSPAHAAIPTDTQISQVQALLASFNTDQQMISAVSAVLRGKPAGMGMGSSSPSGAARPSVFGQPGERPSCPIFDHTLRQGSQGDDVAQLQAFLQGAGDLQGTTTTTFFGPQTRDALQMWQARMGIVTSGDPSTTGFGMLGPATRAAMSANCNSQGSNRGGQGMPDTGTSTGSSTLPAAGGPVPQAEVDALFKALGYSGDFSTSSEAAWKNASSSRAAQISLLIMQLKQHPGDGAMEVYTLYPNLNPTYVSACGLPKMERDALARSLGFAGMFGVLDTQGNVVILGDFANWLTDPAHASAWAAACKAAVPNPAANPNKEVDAQPLQPAVNVASVIDAMGGGVAAIGDFVTGIIDSYTDQFK